MQWWNVLVCGVVLWLQCCFMVHCDITPSSISVSFFGNGELIWESFVWGSLWILNIALILLFKYLMMLSNFANVSTLWLQLYLNWINLTEMLTSFLRSLYFRQAVYHLFMYFSFCLFSTVSNYRFPSTRTWQSRASVHPGWWRRGPAPWTVWFWWIRYYHGDVQHC